MRHVDLVFFAVLGLASVAGIVDVVGAEAKPASYSQEVDNTTEGRFDAPESWGTSSYGKGVSKEDYRFARPAENSKPARFKVEIPEDGDYAVYARWPKVSGLNASVPVGVATDSGIEWTRVNQQRNGGRWVRLGVYSMRTSDDYSVLFSRETSGTEYVGADAVKVQKAGSGSASTTTPGSSAKSGRSTGSAKGEQVVREARKWSGVRYRLGGSTRSGIDCSGFTMMVYKKFGVSLPHSDDAQYRYGKKVSGALQPGDLVFFNEHGDGISHEGIYAGNGKILHASDYFGEVAESDMKYIKGYVGARRLL